MSGLPAKIFLAILVIVFVGAGQCTFRSNFPVLHASTLYFRKLWKISAWLHVLSSPVFHVQLKKMRLYTQLIRFYNCGGGVIMKSTHYPFVSNVSNVNILKSSM